MEIRATRERAIEILTSHQRISSQYCSCGWGQLGRSYPEHQIEMLEKD